MIAPNPNTLSHEEYVKHYKYNDEHLDDFVYCPFFPDTLQTLPDAWSTTAIADAGIHKRNVVYVIKDISDQLDRNTFPIINGHYICYKFLYDLAHYVNEKCIMITPLMAAILGNALMNNGSEVQRFWENVRVSVFTDEWMKHAREELKFVYYYTSFHLHTQCANGYWVHEPTEQRIGGIRSEHLMDDIYCRVMRKLSFHEQRTVSSLIKKENIENLPSLVRLLKKEKSHILNKFQIVYKWPIVSYNMRCTFECVFLSYAKLHYSEHVNLGQCARRLRYETNTLSDSFMTTELKSVFFPNI